ncbi:MAG: hypothetical protein ACFFCW_00005, partial [Candidatus Hodarchaeota archaeon]
GLARSELMGDPQKRFSGVKRILFELPAGMKTVAEHFNRDPVPISQRITKLKQKLMPDGALQQKMPHYKGLSLPTGKREYLFSYA